MVDIFTFGHSGWLVSAKEDSEDGIEKSEWLGKSYNLEKFEKCRSWDQSDRTLQFSTSSWVQDWKNS